MTAETEQGPDGTRRPKKLHDAPRNPDACVVIGDQSGQPAISIQPSTAFSDYGNGQRRNQTEDPIGRLGALLQSIPSLFVAGEGHGKQLYEVVINGELVRAADGNGLRAIAMGPKGIREHARLFESGALQNMINAAAVWQVASVVVAQKHLADISRKLDQIAEGVSGVSRFLDSEREAKIEAAWRYLAQAKNVLAAGELPTSIRGQLEQCERDLIGIQIHLHKEFMQILEKPVPHNEKVGTGELAHDISRKISKLESVLGTLRLCLQTRIAAWHVLCLFPGEPRLKDVRHRDIQQAVYELGALMPAVDRELDREIGAVTSFFTPGSTLRQRRETLREAADALAQTLSDAWSATDRAARHAARLLRRHDESVRLLLCYDSGALEEIRQVP